ncbi:MAG TPA: type IV toxin-antitoxin system AbiEi family antitoxin domain-containing protein [Solirubrobacteraceae bacterium]|nr:type IV toxin-antitoxin system AbiEi family antitoxin domain-containing protein [Solirubrobacteraceae bacterium]
MHEVERAIARIGARQDNVISRDQLLRAGLGRGAIAHRVATGAWQRLHKNVYLLGPAPPSLMARARAAALSCGADAVVSHRSAAEMLGLLPESGGEVHVTVAGRNVAPRGGVRRHRIAAFGPGELTKMRGIPVTTVARAICDMAGTQPRREVEHAYQEALYRRIVTDRQIAAILKREPRRKGAPLVRALLDNPGMTRSERERALRKLIAQAQLPKPLTNVRLHGYLVDAYWPEHGLVLEFDGWQAHGHRSAFETDRKRDQVMAAHGLRVIRITDRQLKYEPVAVAARIAMSLSHAPALGRPELAAAANPAGEEARGR